MSTATFQSLNNAYNLSQLTPALIAFAVMIIIFIMLVMLHIHKKNVHVYHLNKIYPYAIKHSNNIINILMTILVLDVILVIVAYVPASWNKPSPNAIRYTYVYQAIQYQHEIPEQKAKMKYPDAYSQSNFVKAVSDKQIYNKIQKEKKFIKKYRNLKGIHKPTFKRYFLINDDGTQNINLNKSLHYNIQKNK